MTDNTPSLWTLAINFAFISLFAIGGANAAVPEMHRLSVVVMHWMNDKPGKRLKLWQLPPPLRRSPSRHG